ncbi:MAG TPA: DUF4013 domain-containing protein [Bacteroidota bacterium]|nr:DUF4013 domain-containing protein [Bacteroidota bacterium]
MDLARSFSHVFKDSSWFFKVFVGGLFLILSMAGVGIPFVLGYEARHVASISRQQDSALPEWKRLSGIFREGMTIVAAMLVYLTVIILTAAGAAGGHLDGVTIGVGAMAALAAKPLLIILYVRRKTFIGCFRLDDVMRSVFHHPALFAVGLGVSFLTVLGTLALGWMSLILGWPFVIFWGIIVNAHIAGQLATIS